MDIPLNAAVKCTDGTEGRSVCIIINPIHQEVTHVVIETKGLLGSQFMVPVDRIISSTPHEILMRCTQHELIKMAPFISSQFVGPEDTGYFSYEPMIGLEEGHLWPYTAPEDYGAYVGVEQIPHDELGIHRGAHVEATDGRIGQVDEFIINPVNNHISHLVLRQGHLWGKKDVMIPVSDIKSIQDDIIYLKLNKELIKQLPGIAVKRNKR